MLAASIAWKGLAVDRGHRVVQITYIPKPFSTERKVETTSSTRIAAGLILGLACFAAVLTGGIFVGQTIGEALSALQTVAPVEVDPLR